MKNVWSIVLGAILALSLVGCSGSGQVETVSVPPTTDEVQTTSMVTPTSAEPGAMPTTSEVIAASPTKEVVAALPTKDEVIVATANLMDQYWTTVGTDWNAFSSLYRDTDSTVIQSDYDSGVLIDGYDSVAYTLVASADPYYWVNVTYYIVTGSHPNTHMSADSFNIIVSRDGNSWYFNLSEQAANAVNEASTDNPALYPDAFLAAAKAGRNAATFSSYNYMYCNPTSIYEGCSNSEVKFACQNEEGNVLIYLWLANGTDQNIYYTTADISLTDDNLGTIVAVSEVSVNLPVKAKYGALYLLTIPSDQVATGTSAWGRVGADCTVHF